MPKNEWDIPGTFVFDANHSRKGYHLNMFCMSLNDPANREAFRQGEAVYLEQFDMTADQKRAVLGRDWLGMLELGGNIYYTFKLAMLDGLSMQHVGGEMSGITEDAFRQMMLDGGRSPDG